VKKKQEMFFLTCASTKVHHLSNQKIEKRKKHCTKRKFGSFFSFWKSCEILLENLILAKQVYFPLFLAN
jgi:hypothetical protein